MKSPQAFFSVESKYIAPAMHHRYMINVPTDPTFTTNEPESTTPFLILW
jgi:hypothetical protein